MRPARKSALPGRDHGILRLTMRCKLRGGCEADNGETAPTKPAWPVRARNGQQTQAMKSTTLIIHLSARCSSHEFACSLEYHANEALRIGQSVPGPHSTHNRVLRTKDDCFSYPSKCGHRRQSSRSSAMRRTFHAGSRCNSGARIGPFCAIIGAGLSLTSEERTSIIDRLLGCIRAGLPILNSWAGLSVLRSGAWPRRFSVASVRDVNGSRCVVAPPMKYVQTAAMRPVPSLRSFSACVRAQCSAF
jgi:hypothetical protein